MPRNPMRVEGRTEIDKNTKDGRKYPELPRFFSASPRKASQTLGIRQTAIGQKWNIILYDIIYEDLAKLLFSPYFNKNKFVLGRTGRTVRVVVRS